MYEAGGGSLLLLVFWMSHIHWRKIQIQVKGLQTSQIKHRRIYALCM